MSVDRIQRGLAGIAVILAAVFCGCSGDAAINANGDSDSIAEGGGEHDRDGGENGGGEDEESGTELALNEIYDQVRNGVRLIMAYDAETNSFNGTVDNTTDRTLKRVRVEVHLSNGKELGPTTPADLAPGEKRDIELVATGRDFDGWTAHPEVGGET